MILLAFFLILAFGIGFLAYIFRDARKRLSVRRDEQDRDRLERELRVREEEVERQRREVQATAATLEALKESVFQVVKEASADSVVPELDYFTARSAEAEKKGH